MSINGDFAMQRLKNFDHKKYYGIHSLREILSNQYDVSDLLNDLKLRISLVHNVSNNRSFFIACLWRYDDTDHPYAKEQSKNWTPYPMALRIEIREIGFTEICTDSYAEIIKEGGKPRVEN
jgi:hypothetical protein